MPLKVPYENNVNYKVEISLRTIIFILNFSSFNSTFKKLYEFYCIAPIFRGKPKCQQHLETYFYCAEPIYKISFAFLLVGLMT